MNTIYLTAGEQNVFQNLSPALREGWEVKEETLNAYETDEELDIRAHISRLSKHPAVAALMAQLKAGTPVQSLSINDIPEDILPTFYFAIGARGVSTLIMILLSELATDEDMQGLSGFTAIRHDILETNASVPNA